MKTFLLGVTLLLGLVLVSIQHGIAEVSPADDSGAKCPDQLVYTGGFENRFGFSAVIPEGYQGYWNSAGCGKSDDGDGCACLGDHGRFIPLGEKGGIDLYAGFNTLLYQNAKAAVDDRIERVKESAKKGSVKILKRFATRLDTLPAQRVVLGYTDLETGLPMIEDVTLALRSIYKSKGPIPSHAYTVSLATPKPQYQTHREVLERVLKSWKEMAPDDQK